MTCIVHATQHTQYNKRTWRVISCYRRSVICYIRKAEKHITYMYVYAVELGWLKPSCWPNRSEKSCSQLSLINKLHHNSCFCMLYIWYWYYSCLLPPSTLTSPEKSWKWRPNEFVNGNMIWTLPISPSLSDFSHLLLGSGILDHKKYCR